MTAILSLSEVNLNANQKHDVTGTLVAENI